MPRAVNGTYTLPAGNPVVTATVISSTWANTTLADLATAMTASLDRSGNGAMLAGLKLFDGAVGTPGLTWGTETTSGLYRVSAGVFGYSIAGVIKLQINTNGIQVANGVLATPSLSFINDPDCGLYRQGANDIYMVAGGVLVTEFILNGAVPQQLGPDGTLLLPGMGFNSDPDTGLRRPQSNRVNITCGGVDKLIVDSTFIEPVVVFGVIDGTLGAPGLYFQSDTDCGLFRTASDLINIGSGGINLISFLGPLASAVPRTTFNRIFGAIDGTAANPAMSFENDLDTGVYRVGSNQVGIATGGALSVNFAGPTARFGDGFASGDRICLFNNVARSAANLEHFINYAPTQVDIYSYDGAVTTLGTVRFRQSQVFYADGAVGTPVISFVSDPDTGFYRTTADQIAIALGGVTAGQIAQGTFTATLTGYAANPTGTVTYTRIGKHVFLRCFAGISGVSNATTMTMTGLPAAIQPSVNADNRFPTLLIDNTLNLLAGAGVVSGGTITFQLGVVSGTKLAMNSAGFTVVGTKGIDAFWGFCYEAG